MKNAKQNNIFIILLIIVVAFSSVFFAGSACVAYAEDTVEYSDVLSDLHRDSNFDESAYPEDIDDYSISLIQIAEGVDGDVFVYVYQPSASSRNLLATGLNISIVHDTPEDLWWKGLELCNSNGVFYKYKILDFKQPDSDIRYYYISSIFRKVDKYCDEPLLNGNTQSDIGYEVGKEYAFCTKDGKRQVECRIFETIEITDKFVGFVRYDDGYYGFYNGACDSHFVAFNTDKPMDKLLEAKVQYSKQIVDHNTGLFGAVDYYKYGKKSTDNYVNLEYTQSYKSENQGLFADSYEWDRIQTIDEFMSEVECTDNLYSGAVLDVTVAHTITDEAKETLKNMKWVLRFTETSLVESGTWASQTTEFTQVGDVTILRLKFEYDGVVYDLGVVDNKQTGSSEPINPDWNKPFGGDLTVTITEKGKETLNKILIIIICIAVVVLLIPVFKAIYQHKKSKRKEYSSPKRSSSSTRKSNNKKPNKKTSKKR